MPVATGPVRRFAQLAADASDTITAVRSAVRIRVLRGYAVARIADGRFAGE